MPFIVPGIGYAGLGQQTAANQAVFRRAMSGNGTGSARTSRRKVRVRGRARRTSARLTRRMIRTTPRGSTRRFKAARMVKGSAAAKRHMAKLRRMIKRR